MQPNNIEAASVGRTESDIAALAYRLWQENGCPDGLDQEHWFRAEEMLLPAPVAESAAPPSHAPTTAAMPERRVEYEWQGHWEVWEREWGAPRWVCGASLTMY